MNRLQYEDSFKLSLAMAMLEIAGYPAKSEQFKKLHKQAVERLNENAKRDYLAFLAADRAALQKAIEEMENQQQQGDHEKET